MLAQLQKIEQIIVSGDKEAIAKSLKTLEKLGKKHPSGEVLLVKANALKALGQILESANTFAAAAEKGGPLAGKLWLRAGFLYQECQKMLFAKAAYQHALECMPESLDARNNLAVAMYQASQAPQALPHARWLMEHSPHAEHYITANYVFRANMLLDDALNACRKALETAPDNWTVIAASLQAFQHAADWEGVNALTAKYMDAYANNLYATASELPLVNITWCMDEKINCNVAKHAANAALKGSVAVYDHQHRKQNTKPRIGYVSADLRNHAIMHLTAGIFEQHDREKYDLFVYSHSPNDGSPYRTRMLNALGNSHIDTRAMNDAQLAQRIYDDNIDVLVDLMGLTEKNRLPMFRMRPAPILCTWLGFPGTTGFDFLDYAITDPIVTPDSSKPFFTEKLCRLPETYQSNDFKRTIASNAVSRTDCNLPENALVLASFNQTSKIDSHTFSAWMRLLRDLPDACLWILDPGTQAQQYFTAHAKKESIDPTRIVFAKRTPPPLHLARLSLADIIIDTRIYNGHTTTSDALWAGVPVFTVPGTHFASRVSASLLHACGLPECIATDWEDFHRKVCTLAQDSTARKALREKLARNRFIAPLYDTERFTRHLEKAYDMMLQRHASGLAPDDLDVPALPARTTPFCSVQNVREVTQSESRDNSPSLQDQPIWQLSHAVCPLCKHEDFSGLRKQEWSLHENPDQYNAWYICKKCDHVFTQKYWTAEGRAIATEKFPPANITTADNPFVARERAGRILQAVTQMLKTGYGTQKTATWAEIYPVDGWLPLTVLEQNFNITVVAECEHQQKQFAKWIKRTTLADFLTLNIRGQVDIVSLNGTLERVNFPPLYLERAANILKDDGIMLITFANPASVAWQIAEQQGLHPEWNNPYRMHFYSINRLDTLLKERGLEIVHCEVIPGERADSLIIAKKQR